MKFKSLLLIILLLIIPIFASASEMIYATCEKQNDDYICKISGNFEYEVSALDFHFSLPTYATLDSYKLDSRWIGNIDGDWITLYSDNNSKDTFLIAEFVIKSNKKIDEDDILFHDIKVYDGNYQEHEIVIEKTNKKITIEPIVIIGIILLGIVIIILVRRKGDSK